MPKHAAPRRAFLEGAAALDRWPVRALAALLSFVFIAASLTVGLWAAPAQADSNVALAATTNPSVLAGENASVSLEAQSLSSSDYFNVSLRYELPVGVSYVGGSTSPVTAGEPQVVTITTVVEVGPPEVTESHQVLIWANTADLPHGDSFSLEFEVDPDPALYPVGADFGGSAGVYTSNNARILPKFDANGTPVPSGGIASDVVTPTPTTVSAIELTKSEPSPESELMRGVHTQTTTYTVRVENTTVAATDDVIVVDYLPAGLEFLGCGATDHSSAEEYPGSGHLDAPAVPSCVIPVSVETVEDPAGIGTGVFTKVTWALGTFTPGQVVEIQYRAGIPLLANTLEWPADVPTPASLEQGSNLDNNSGASTRQVDDGSGFTNTAIATGTYTGLLAPGSQPTVSADDSYTVVSSDLSIVKSGSTGTFSTGEIVTFTLRLRASEYATTAGMVITDEIPDGLCPLLPVGTTIIGTMPADCTTTGSIGGATVTSVTVNADESFTMVLVPSQDALILNADTEISYAVLMRTAYVESSAIPTVSGDSFRNEVDITGTSTTAVDSDDEPLQSPATEPVSDDSAAGLASLPPSIDKQILERTDLGTDPCPASGYTDLEEELAPTFQLGDRICFELRVDFSTNTETRNAQVTDFVPVGTSFDGYTTAPGSPDVELVVDPSNTDSPTWLVGETRGTDRYVGKGAVLVLYVSVTVVSVPESDTVDITANLMKFRQESTGGTVLSLRDQADFGIAPPPLVSIDKGIVAIDGADVTTGGEPIDSSQVRERTVVTYRVDVSNISSAADGNDFDVQNIGVWDALPPGILCAQVSAISFAGECTDDFAGFSGANSGRSAIIWTLTDLVAPGAAHAPVTYDVTIPDGVSVSTQLKNTASVVAYTSPNTAGGDSDYFPRGSLDASHATTGNVPPSNDDASSTVSLPSASVTKTGVTSITETNNGLADAVAGELVDYSYSVTVPAHTTVFNGVLSDSLPSGLGIVSGTTVTADLAGVAGYTPATMPTGYTLAANGTLTLPATLDNTTDADQQFTVHLTGVQVSATSSMGTKTNTASFTSTPTLTSTTAVATPPATFAITVKQPVPRIQKTVNPTTVAAGQTITFTLKSWNENARTPLHNSVIVDCLPAGLAFGAYGTLPTGVTTEPAVEGTGANGCADQTTKLVWNLGTLQPTIASPGDAAKVVLAYTAVIDPAAAGLASYMNRASLTGFTVEGGAVGASATASATATPVVSGVTTSKVVTKLKAAVGDSNGYTITVPLPANVNFYDAAIIDTLPAGVTGGTATITCLTATETDCMADLPAAGSALPPAGTSIGWLLGDVTSKPYIRTVTVTLPVTVSDVSSNTIGATVRNSARLSWYPSTQAGTPANAGITFPSNGVPGAVDFTVTAPALTIAKLVVGATPAPGDSFTYSVVVTNANGTNNSAAYNAIVTDVVPAGVVVDESTLTNGGVLTGNTITWTLAGPIVGGTPVTLTYSAALAASATVDTTALTNTADITSYTSVAGGGHTYTTVTASTATVTPRFPHVALAKAISGSAVAYVGTPFGWTVTLTNDGNATAATVTPSDVLPANWTYDAGSAFVSVAGAPAVQLNPATSPINGVTNVQTLTWAPFADLASTKTIVITYTATPQPGALGTPGVGASVPHINTLTATTTDATGASSNKAGSYTGTQAFASAHIDAADLAIAKTAGAELLAGTVVPGAWTITVSNVGPNTAIGTSGTPFVVTDTLPTLPEGVTVTAASGTGWSCSVPDSDGEFSCTRTGSLASGSSFEPISVTATVAASVVAGTSVTNTASVSAFTHDPITTNNSSTRAIPVVASADLAVTKTLNGTARAGQSVSWTVGVSNLGPSSSAGPIVITDTFPAGVSAVTATGTGWDCTTQTTTITCTYDDPIAVGPAGSITVTGTLGSGVTGDITNSAAVTSRVTPDPVTTNDSASVASTVDTSTTITLTKTLVGPVVDTAATIVPGAPATYEFVVTTTGAADARGVSISDTLPAGLTFSSYEAVTGTWDCSGTATVECDLTGTLATGTSATVRITVDVPSDLAVAVDNHATASADNAPDANGAALDPSTARANFEIVKTHPAGEVIAGGTVTYTIAARNLGPSDSPGDIVVTDTLPSGMSLVSADGTGWTCESDPPTVTCTYPAELPATEAAPPITLVALVAPSAGPATLLNEASVNGPLPTDDPSKASTTDSTVVTDSATITITKAVTSGPTVVAGEDVTYTLTVDNDGLSDADSLSVTDTLPNGLMATSISGDGWTCVLASLSCTRDTLAPGESVITIVATASPAVADGTVLTNETAVTWLSGTEPGQDDDSASVTVEAVADLLLTKTAVEETVIAGETASFTITVENLGQSDAVGPVTIVDTLPVGLSYLSSTPEWDCAVAAADASGQVVTCTLDNGAGIPAGRSASELSITAQVDAAAPAGELTNGATVTSATYDPDLENNTDDATVTVELSADLSIVKTHTGTVRIGDPLDFGLAVSNGGPSAAAGVTVVDTLPAGLTWVDSAKSDPAWTCIAAAPAADGTTTITCELAGSLAPSTDAPALVITTTVEARAYPSVENTATVGSDIPDPSSEFDTSTDVVAVPPLVELQVSKEHLGEVRIGERATYLISVGNTGPTEDPGGFSIVDELPAGLAFYAYSGDDVTCEIDEQIVTCVFDGPLAIGEERTVTLVVDVLPTAPAEIVNVVAAQSLYEEVSTDGLVADDTATVLPAYPALASTGLTGLDLIGGTAGLLTALGIALLLLKRRRNVAS